ncbi:18799_t:CDS:2, partial [Racocetra fulgida]
IKNAIDIIKMIMNQATDDQTRKKYQYLKQILLTNQEWDILKSLVKILLSFAEATTFLGSSKFSIVETPFDDNINFDDINFDELLENELDSNSLEDYNFVVEKKFLTHNELLFSLLNPQHKKLEFISKSEQKLTKDILIKLYNDEQNN